jgi:hypothetical protein
MESEEKAKAEVVQKALAQSIPLESRCQKSLAFMPLCGLKFFILILRVKNSLKRGA